MEKAAAQVPESSAGRDTFALLPMEPHLHQAAIWNTTAQCKDSDCASSFET